MERAGDDPPAGPQVVHLDDSRLFELMETVQDDAETHVMQAPKLTTFNGQVSSIQLHDFKWFVTDVQVVERAGKVVFVPQNRPVPLGWSLGVQSTASADRRSVRVALDMQMTRQTSATAPLPPIQNILRPEKSNQETPLQRANLSRWRVKHVVNVADQATAVLSGWKIRQEPGQQTEDAYLLLAVTPRIIVSTEEETVSTGVDGRAAGGVFLRCYDEACKRGRLDEARSLALEALKLDPTCFSRPR